MLIADCTLVGQRFALELGEAQAWADGVSEELTIVSPELVSPELSGVPGTQRSRNSEEGQATRSPMKILSAVKPVARYAQQTQNIPSQ